MADLVVDYELLYQAATQLSGLESERRTLDGAFPASRFRVLAASGAAPATATPGGGAGEGAAGGADSSGFGRLDLALTSFHVAWDQPLSDAGHQIDQLTSTFKGVARAFFEADASQAGEVNAGIATSAARNYPHELADYQTSLAAWMKLKDPDHVPYYDIDGVKHFMAVPKPTAPPAPSDPYTGPSGATTTYSTGGTDPNDPNQGPLITSETTTYDSGGLHYSETTVFGPDQGWVNGGPVQDTTTTITHSDGSTDTITTTLHLDGSASAVDVSSGGTTTTSTRASWQAPWVTHAADGSGGHGGGGGGGVGGGGEGPRGTGPQSGPIGH